MAVKKYKPITPGLRSRISTDNSHLSKGKPEKSLLTPLKRSGGRNHDGKMTVRNIGGGHKRKYRIIDFKRDKDGVVGEVKSLEYDPNRSANIALIEYTDGEKRYIIAPDGLEVGGKVVSGEDAAPEIGNALPLSKIPLGSDIHAIEMTLGKGAALARGAGTVATKMGQEGKYVIVKLPSGEVRRILAFCRATIGSTSNPDHRLQNLGKAGRRRWMGRRPRVRGVAMNPVDHPMGGGEGRASGGHPRSRTGIMAKGQKTRDPNKKSNRLIISKRKSKK